MYDDGDDVDYDAFDHVVLQVFEEQEDRSGVLTYPLTSQKHALDFIKLMNRKGFPYQSMCDTIGEKPETFRSWRLGNGNSQIGLIMMKRINRAVQEAMNMADADIDDGFLDDIHSDDDTVDSSDAFADDKSADATPPATTITDETVSDVTSSPCVSDVIVNDGNTKQPESDDKPIEDLSNTIDADNNASAKDDINRTIDDVMSDVTIDVPDGEHCLEVPCDGGNDGAVIEQVTDSKLESLQSTQSCQVMQSQSDDTNTSAVDAELDVGVDVKNEQESAATESAATDSSSLVGNVAASVADQTLSSESTKESDGSLESQAGLADSKVDDLNVNSIAAQTAANDDVTLGKINCKEEANESEQIDGCVEKLETAVFAESATKDLSESEQLKTDSSNTSDSSSSRAAETTPNEPSQQIVSDKEPTTTESKLTVERELEPEVPPVQKPEEPAPKVEYEASTKQLDLLSRLSMLRERAAQRKTSEDKEKPPEETATTTTASSSASLKAPITFSSHSAEKGAVVDASLPQSIPDNTSPDGSSSESQIRKSDELDSKTGSNKTELVPVENNNISSDTVTIEQPQSHKNSKKPTVDTSTSTPDVTPSSSSPSNEPVHKSQLGSQKSTQSTAVVETDQQDQRLAADKSRATSAKADSDAMVSREKVVDSPVEPQPELSRNNAEADKMALQTAIAKPEEQQSDVTENSRSTADVSKSDSDGSFDVQTTTKATTTTTTSQNATLPKEPKTATTVVGSIEQTSEVTQTNNIPPTKGANTTEKPSKRESDHKELPPTSASTVPNQQKEVTAKTNKTDDIPTASSKADDKQTDKCQPILPQQSNNIPSTKGAHSTEKQSKREDDHKELPPTSASTVTNQQKEVTAKTNKTDYIPTASSKADDKQTDKCQPVLPQQPITTTSSSQQRRPLRSDVIINKKSFDGSVSDSYDSDLDAAASNDKTYSLVDRVRKLKANVVESPGYLYVFTDQTTGETLGGSGGGEFSGGRRFKVGVTRYPDKRYQQALSFNPSLCSLVVAKVSRRIEALRLARSKLGQFKLEGTADWFACDEEIIAEAVENIVNETKA